MKELKRLDKEAIEIINHYGLLETIVQKELVCNCISDVQIEDEKLDKIKDSIFKKEGLNNEEEFEAWLANSKMTRSSFFEKITKPMKINKYCLEKYANKINSRFLKRKSDLDFVTYRMVRVSNEFLARELYHRLINEEETFGQIAKEYSTGPEKERQGIIGPSPLSQAHPKLIEILKSLQPGDINEPVALSFRKQGEIHVICCLENLIEAKLDEEMKLQMAKELFELWLEEQAAILCRDLRN